MKIRVHIPFIVKLVRYLQNILAMYGNIPFEPFKILLYRGSIQSHDTTRLTSFPVDCQDPQEIR